MNELKKRLLELGIHNNHKLLTKFKKKNDVVCSFNPYKCEVHVWVSTFTTVSTIDGETNYYCYILKRFPGLDSMLLALRWASQQYKIKKWCESPFKGFVPVSFLERVKQSIL